MCSTSMTPRKSFSLPIGIAIATQRGESCSWIERERRAEVGAVAVEVVDEDDARAAASSSQRRQSREVMTSTPATPETVKSAPSTTRSAPSASATKLGSPGRVEDVELVPSCSACSSEPEIDIVRRFSSSS